MVEVRGWTLQRGTTKPGAAQLCGDMGRLAGREYFCVGFWILFWRFLSAGGAVVYRMCQVREVGAC